MIKRLAVSLAAVLATVCCIAVPAASASVNLGPNDQLHVWAPSFAPPPSLVGAGEVTGTAGLAAIEVCVQYANVNTGFGYVTVSGSCYNGPPGTHNRSQIYDSNGVNYNNFIATTCFRTWDYGLTGAGDSATSTSQVVCPT